MTKTTTRPTEFALEANIVRESEKAILVRCFCMRAGYHDVWFPKSQVSIEGGFIFGPTWLADAKARDTGRSLGLTNLNIARSAVAEKLAA